MKYSYNIYFEDGTIDVLDFDNWELAKINQGYSLMYAGYKVSDIYETKNDYEYGFIVYADDNNPFDETLWFDTKDRAIKEHKEFAVDCSVSNIIFKREVI